MANYNLVTNSKFKPLTFDELVKPFIMYGAEYKAQEEAFTTLAEQSEVLRQRAAKEPNSEWAKTYNDFANRLSAAADNLATNGLNPASRQSTYNLKKDYNGSIVPIHTAIKQEFEDRDFQSKQDPRLRNQYGAMPTIDERIADPTKRFTTYSGASIEQSAMLSAKAASLRNVIENFGKYRYGWMQHVKETGFDNDALAEILAAANDPSIAGNKEAKIILDIIKNTQDQFGYNNDNTLTQEQKNALNNEVLSGIYKGVEYKNDNSYQQDPIAMAYLNADLADRNNYRQAVRAAAGKAEEKKRNTNIIRRNLYTQEEIDKNKNLANQYDAKKTTAWGYPIDSTNANEAMNAILMSYAGDKIPTAEYKQDKKSKQYSYTASGKSISKSELASNYEAIDMEISSYGTTITFKSKKGGDTKTILLQNSYNPTQEKAITDAAINLQDIYNEFAKMNESDPNYNIVLQSLENATYNLYDYAGYLFGSNKTKPSEVNSTMY